MSAAQPIRCHCGARVLARHVLQKGFVMIQWTPVFVYLQYRCGSCHELGEAILAYEEWDPSLLQTEVPSLSVLPRPFLAEDEPERERLAALHGRIRPDEVSQFAWAISQVTEVDFERLRASLSS